MRDIPPPPGACVKRAHRRDGETEIIYKIDIDPLPSRDMHSYGVMLNDARLAKIADREEFIGYQKAAAASGDRDGARFFKSEAADALKEYRALCLIIPHFLSDPPGDCRYTPQWEWPVELGPWIDRAVWRIVLHQVSH